MFVSTGAVQSMTGVTTTLSAPHFSHTLYHTTGSVSMVVRNVVGFSHASQILEITWWFSAGSTEKMQIPLISKFEGDHLLAELRIYCSRFFFCFSD